MIESEIQEFPRGLVDVIARAHNRFRRIQYGEGFWWAELESNATMDAEFILVTHPFHMPRALRAFTPAAGADIRVIPAPIGLVRPGDRPVLDWLPSSKGFVDVRDILREMLGLLVRA